VSVLLLDYDFFTIGVRGADVGMGVRVLVAVAVDGVENFLGDLVGSFVETVTERVVVAVFVVISHITLELLGGVNRRPCSLLYADCFSRVTGVDCVNTAALRRVGVVSEVEALLGVPGGLLKAWLGGEAGVTFLDDGTGTFTELALGNVNLRGGVLGG